MSQPLGLTVSLQNKLVKLLVKFASRGKAVISTIHQPSSKIFRMFPSLLLLMDGYTIFHGPANSSIDYFHKLGFSAPEYSNPADYFLKEFYIPFNKQSNDEIKIKMLTKSFKDVKNKQKLSRN
jgi:ABC-type multidrug transport system ATPase subunit